MKLFSSLSQPIRAANLLIWAGTCPNQQKFTMLIRIHLTKEVLTKSKTPLFADSSRKESHLITFPTKKLRLSNIGLTICRVKSSITIALILFSIVSYLILQFRLFSSFIPSAAVFFYKLIPLRLYFCLSSWRTIKSPPKMQYVPKDKLQGGAI